MSKIPDLGDPRWFPLEYLPDIDSFRFVWVEQEMIGATPFLDQRMGSVSDASIPIPASSISQELPSPPAFLFHTAFCGSTLLARALHAPPLSVSLKEPQALLALAFAARNPAVVDFPSRLRTALVLLSRPWASGGRVLIKPTNQANNLISPLLATSHESRGLLLYSSLEEFLVSCFKKLPESETRIRWMAQHLIVGTELAKNLGVSPRQTFNLVESCVLTWFAQMELYAVALASDRDDRLRSLDMASMFAAQTDCVRSCSQWLGLDLGEGMSAHVSAVFSRDSKTAGRHYDNTLRETEKIRIQATFGEIISRACAWAETQIAPVARLPGDWKPLLF